MKIVHLIFSFMTGGAEAMLIDIMNDQVCLGHDVSLVVINDCYDDKNLSMLNSQIHRVMLMRNPSSHNIWPAVRLNLLLWKMHPDAIHLHHNSISKMLLCPRPGYLTVHDLDISLSTACSKLKELFAISEAVRKDVQKRYPGKFLVKTIPNGIRIDDILRKSTYQLREGRMRVVQVARLDYEKKGQDLIIGALSLLRERNLKSIEVDFIGAGELQHDLEKISKDKGVEDVVHFLGLHDRNEIYEELKNYDLMCHPSRYEGFGLTVAEGIAAGLPVLVPDSDGPFEIIQYGRFGYSFKKDDVLSLANALQDIYEHYEERAQCVVKAAYDHVKDNYNLRLMVEHYIEEYHKFAR